MLPTKHGFDEFYGNLYHLNAEEEPENAEYPKDPEFKKKFGPRGVWKPLQPVLLTVLKIKMGKIGKQTIKDLGPLNTKEWRPLK